MTSNNLKHPGAGAAASSRARPGWRALGVIIPILLAAPPLGRQVPGPPPTTGEVPPAHALNVWLDDSDGLDVDQVGLRQASRQSLARSPLLHPELAAQVIGGFTQVGSVAVLEGDDATVKRLASGYGVDGTTLAVVSTRFIQAFGDDYDQIAVFLAFPDRASPQALAYQQPVKNDTRGIGLGLFDSSAAYGSKGRMQTVLNMKRISVYGRDAAADPDNGLYAVWAQEAAHRWLVYFRLRQANDTSDSDLLLGRQKVHWSRGVAAEGSILDGFSWKDNGDGTFTPGRRGYRYGALDQYGMGLLPAAEVPPFFLLADITDQLGNVIPEQSFLSSTGKYKGRKIPLTIEDIVRANGPRMPASDPAAEDLRMGVVLLGAPGVPAGQLIGEAFVIDKSRRFWTDFYNTAGEGRGKVCTELYRPCRGGAFEFSELQITEGGPGGDGAVAPGEAATVHLKVTNVGDAAARAKLTVDPASGLELTTPGAETELIEKGQSLTVKLPGRVASTAACGQPLAIDVRSAGSKGSSRQVLDTAFGLKVEKLEDFEGDGASAWRVNPDGTDMGQAGRWAVGQPERTIFLDYILQPGTAFSGARAFSTGLAGMETDNVEGRTTLESPVFPVKGVARPVLSYRVYFVGAAFGQEVLVPAPGATLKVLASSDGASWTQVDEVRGMATGWERRLISLPEKLGPALEAADGLRFRFVAEELDMSRPVVEAAIDDVGIYATSCQATVLAPEPTAMSDDGGDCGCRLGAAPRGARAGSGSLGLLLAAALLTGLRSGRRRRAQAKQRGPRCPRP